MIKIGITGSIASGKSTVARILSKNNRRLFSADHVVKKLYSSPDFQKKLIKKFKLNKKKVKEEIKKRLLKKELNLKDLGKFIQPFVRKKMKMSNIIIGYFKNIFFSNKRSKRNL